MPRRKKDRLKEVCLLRSVLLEIKTKPNKKAFLGNSVQIKLCKKQKRFPSSAPMLTEERREGLSVKGEIGIDPASPGWG